MRLVLFALALIFFPVTTYAQSFAPVQTQPGRLVVVYRGGVPADADALLRMAGAVEAKHLRRVGHSVIAVAPGKEEEAMARLKLSREVLAVVRDMVVHGDAVPVRAASKAAVTSTVSKSTTLQRGGGVVSPMVEISGPMTMTPAAFDQDYSSPAGWAVQSAGGYGDDVAGSGNAVGPWNVSLGAGVRIAVLDSGVDARHPDIAPNLAVNISEIDQDAATGQPSACDDGSAQDQQGHGTWAASLAAAAMGPGTGSTIGVAPQATLINIKVLQRLPAATGSSLAAQCEAGEPGGLLSWVLEGIDDAMAQHADVISLSLGTVVDLSTGDGAGWQASFDQATYAAEQAGAVIVASAGNDGLDLSGGRYIELPAQARGVLPVTATTNPACAENLAAGATCTAGAVTRPYYSNYGSTLGAIAAPGGSYPEGADGAVSGWILGACSAGLPNTQDGLPADGESFGCFGLGHTQYVQAMGTSASAPLVAGAAAMVKAAHPGWTAAEIVAALRSSALPSATTDPQLNLQAALAVTF